MLNRLLIATQGLAFPLRPLVIALQALVAVEEQEEFVFGGGGRRVRNTRRAPRLPQPARPQTRPVARMPVFGPDVTWPVAPGRVVIREEDESLLLAGAI